MVVLEQSGSSYGTSISLISRPCWSRNGCSTLHAGVIGARSTVLAKYSAVFLTLAKKDAPD
jgi:hypothetical protein